MHRHTRSVIVALFILSAHFLFASDDLKQVEQISNNKPGAALILLRKVYAKAIEQNDLEKAGISLQRMGQICYNQGHYAQSLDFYLHAEKLFEQLPKKDLYAENMREMGILYYYNKQPEKSRALYKKAFLLFTQSRNVKGQAKVMGDIGHLYEKQEKYDSAFYYQKKALVTYARIGEEFGKAKIYENLGSINEDLGHFEIAHSYFLKSLAIFNQYNDQISSLEVINNIGDILRKTGKYQESIRRSTQALKMAEAQGNLYQKASACRDLGKAYQLLNKMDSAYHYIELCRKYTLDIYSKDGVIQTTFLQVLYDINKKTNEINRLNSNRKINQLIAASATLVILLLLALAFLIISRQRLKIRDERALAKQNHAIYEAQKELMELELKNNHLQEEALKQELELKSRELSAHTLNLIKNNQLLENLRNTLQQMVKDERRDQKKQMQQIVNEINLSFNHEQHWKEFNTAFEQVHEPFLNNLKKHCQDLTSSDLRLIALLKVNMDSRNISDLLGISTDSLRVARYRLRKKLGLSQGDNLSSFIQRL